MDSEISIKEYKQQWQKELQVLYPHREISSIFSQIVENELGWSRLDLALDPQKVLNKHQKRQLDKALIRLKEGEPLQYIMGEAEFYGLPFKVGQEVLIPRPETEELVHWIIAEERRAGIRILDIGTGSGCISVALAKAMPKNKLFAVDVSEGALRWAQKNAALNGVQVEFSKMDILHPENGGEEFDCIVSNPPYVRHSESVLMHKNVLAYEPALALFVDDGDALLFYRKIVRFGKKHLKKGGHIYFEINEYLKAELQRLFEAEECTEIHFREDGFGKIRMVRVKLD